MTYPKFFDAKNTLKLFELEKDFNFLSSLYTKKVLPKTLLLTGNKGSGKATLLNHFLASVFDPNNYDKKKLLISENSIFHKQFKSNVFTNIIYLNGSDHKSVKIDDIRTLKKEISKSTILGKDRFIVLDDVELFNNNSLNALLKAIEEPNEKDFFFLINNKAKPLLETIKSRALEIKIILNKEQNLNIINNLMDLYNLEIIFDPKIIKLSPGNFIKFNYIIKEFDISIEHDLVENLSLLLNLYKKNKDILFINIIFFIVDLYFKKLINKNIYEINNIYEIKNFIFDHLNKFLLFNINQNALINAIDKKLNYE